MPRRRKEQKITIARKIIQRRYKDCSNPSNVELSVLVAETLDIDAPQGRKAASKFLIDHYETISDLLPPLRRPPPKIAQAIKKAKEDDKREYRAFYKTTKWRAVRYEALRNSNGSCQCCGARASDGVQLHVDHIKPRSKNRDLELVLSNLQILCEDCNMGKSNLYDDDWRGLTLVS